MSHPHSSRTVIGSFLLFVLAAAGPAVAWAGRPQPLAESQVIPSSWQIQTVATRGTTGLYNDLALSANGDPRLSYFEVVRFQSGSRYQLIYAYWDGLRWQKELVDPRVERNTQQASLEYTSLKLDEAGGPHIAYVDDANLMYAQRNGSVWEVQEVDPEAEGTMTQASLVLDPGGRPHLSYRKGYDLWYAVRNGAAWDLEVVDTGLAGSFNSLALDADGHPRISYLKLDPVTNHVLKYAAFDGAAWNLQTVDGSADIGGPTALALTSSQSPRIGYMTSAGALLYALWTGSAWLTQTVANLGTNNLDIDLALDSFNSPHLLYSGFGDTSVPLTHAYRTGEAWQFQQLDRADEHMGRDNALALDAQGNVHASYLAAQYTDLRYLAWAPNWLTRTVAAPAGISTTGIQVRQAAPHIAYHNQANDFVSLASWDGAWNIATPDAVSDTVPNLSLALGEAASYLTYYDPDTQRLLYAHWNGHMWSYQEIATGADVGLYSQLVLAGDYGGVPRIAFWDGSALRVKLAELGGPGGAVIVHPNTAGPALDADSGRLSASRMAAGKIGLSYHDAVNEDIRVAVWDPYTGTWTDELVAGASSAAGPWNALETDAASGELVLAYYDATADTIEYAHQDQGIWNIEAEPAVTEAGPLTSLSLELGLSSVERPRIAYTRQGDGGLYLVSRLLSEWVEDTVTTGSPALGSASLALDERAHLAYTDGGLFYAFRTATLDIAAPAPGASPTPINLPFNPLDACMATINFFLGEPTSTQRSSGLAPSRPVAETGPLDDLEIMVAITELFAVTPAGQEYTDLYAQHGAEMGQLGIEDSQLLWDAAGTLQNFLPGLEALVTGRGSEQVVTQEMVDDALDIWQRLAAAGSPELAAAINGKLAMYHNLQAFVGMTFDEWALAIGVQPPSHHVYLPVISR
jgi:hypothetical protein